MKVQATSIAICVLAYSQIAHAQTFPAPTLENSIWHDDLLFTAAGVQDRINSSKPMFVIVNASIAGNSPDSGDPRMEQSSLTITMNGQPCTNDGDSSNSHNPSLSASASCFKYFAAGPVSVGVWGTLFSTGDPHNTTTHWWQFGARQSFVSVMAFPADGSKKASARDKSSKTPAAHTTSTAFAPKASPKK